MTRIAPVNLEFNPKTLWFDAGELEIGKTDRVVVETARGVELGRMAGEVFEAAESDLDKLKSALQPVVRVATEEDVERAAEMERLSKEAMATFKELAASYDEGMHPVSVEYLLEGDKAVFYFEAEERIDFREIVRELASRFHVRIDMRQIGVRDEARMIGGLGHCGQELCCKRLGGEFCPVSIRMAKEQDLSLNPQKISGICGRLMCCLRYEYEAYKDFHQRAPKQNATIQTPDGPAKVCNLNVPREIVDLKIEIDGKLKTVHVPLADMDEPEEGATRPKSVGEEAWRRAIEPPISSAASALFLTSQFTGKDALGDARAVRRNNANVKNATGSTSMVEVPRKPSRRRRRGGSQEPEREAAVDTKRVRRRRSTTVSADGTTVSKATAPRGAEEGAPEGAEDRPTRRRRARGGQRARRSPDGRSADSATSPSVEGEQAEKRPARRPGQKSSGLSQAREGQAGGEGEAKKPPRRRRRGGSGRSGSSAKGGSDQAEASAAPVEGGAERSGSDGRRPRRRRSRRAGESKSEGATDEA